MQPVASRHFRLHSGIEERTIYYDDGRSVHYNVYHTTPFTAFEGFSEYPKLATWGRHYEFLMEKTGMSPDRVKKKLLSDVFGKRWDYWSKREDAFRESFPGVWAFIRRFNRN